MLRLCAVFNVLVGTLATVVSVGIGLFVAGWGADWSARIILEVLVILGPLCFSGILYISSGVALWRSHPAVKGRVLVYQGSAWLLCCAYCLIFFITIGGKVGVGGHGIGHPYDEEIVMFLFIPAAGLLLVGVELCYLWNKWKQRTQTPA